MKVLPSGGEHKREAAPRRGSAELPLPWPTRLAVLARRVTKDEPAALVVYALRVEIEHTREVEGGTRALVAVQARMQALGRLWSGGGGTREESEAADLPGPN